MLWKIKVDESNSQDNPLTLLLQNDQIINSEEDRVILKSDDVLTYDKYNGKKIKVLSVKGNLVEVLLPDDFDRKYLQDNMFLFTT